MTRIYVIFSLLLLNYSSYYSQSIDNSTISAIDTVELYDQVRQRKIPIAIYHSTNEKTNHKKLVIISHGYNQNEGRPYLGYSFIANLLASKGYFVVSIQHELPIDSLIPLTGVPKIVRRPFWERGADNILFVLNELKKSNPELDFKHITLIGHSNGGDMAVLFSQKYPKIIDKIITLDNRRMALPRTKKPKIYSLRSSDQVADKGVLPTEAEMRKFGIKIIPLTNTKHNEMSDNASEEQQKEIQNYILTFLRD